jgi:predicted nuclease with TOPRIM domain
MAKTKEQIEDARRQGQFEGRVETKLDTIHTSLEAIKATTGGLETRLRNIEDSKSGLDEKFKEITSSFANSDKVHEDLYQQIGSVSQTVSNLIKYQSTVKGIMIALGILSTVISPIITTALLKLIFK